MIEGFPDEVRCGTLWGMSETLQGRDKATYVRQQKGHSLILHILLAFLVVGLFTIPYYSISKNHYWHA